MKVIIIFLVFSLSSYAQKRETEFLIVDSLNTPIEDAILYIKNDTNSYTLISDSKGTVAVSINPAQYQITVSHLQYYQYYQPNFLLEAGKKYNIILKQSSNELQEVIITAKEDDGLVTKSIIDRQAMRHLQPSSFSDVMELLPGGRASTPSLTSTNIALIREYKLPSVDQNKYNTSAIGVQFYMDDYLLNSNADMQSSLNAKQTIGNTSGYIGERRSTTTTGIDMRTISTNDIASVEIIRGIPTAAYGDLTSGLIKINRVSGRSPLSLRLKADGYSKLYYISKGIGLKNNWDLNVSMDLLDAKSDPRRENETYKRITSSIRLKKSFYFEDKVIEWSTNLDHNTTIDKFVYDSESGVYKDDRYESSKHKINISNKLSYLNSNESSPFRKMQFIGNIGQGFEDIKQHKLMQLNGPTAIPITLEQGVNDGYFLPIKYFSDFSTEGRPLDINLKLNADFKFNTSSITHAVDVGLDYRYSKNNGKGYIYDLLTPPIERMGVRPRAFSDIPAYQNLAGYIGDVMTYSFSDQSISLYVGTRFSTMLGMDSQYALSNKIFIEPRTNLQWKLPKFKIGQKDFQTDLTLGYGQLYKQPTMSMLYPSDLYVDFVQLNFGHLDENVRRMNYMTYVVDRTNKDLTAAKNVKYEVRLDFKYDRHKFFIAYFNEKMDSGFRSEVNYLTYDYKRYDATGIDLVNIKEPPALEDLPYEDRKTLSGHSRTFNGSQTFKRGIEFGYYSPRIDFLNTKFTLTGAWLKTTYRNTIPIQEIPQVSTTHTGYPYVGVYQSNQGYIYSTFNYNLIVDTYLPALGMNLSASFQGTLRRTEDRAFKDKFPIAYFGADQQRYPLDNLPDNDPNKQWLIRSVSATDNMRDKYGLDLQINLKASKEVFKGMSASLFVNKLYTYAEPYYRLNKRIERNKRVTPYFGMELTYNF